MLKRKRNPLSEDLRDTIEKHLIKAIVRNSYFDYLIVFRIIEEETDICEDCLTTFDECDWSACYEYGSDCEDCEESIYNCKCRNIREQSWKMAEDLGFVTDSIFPKTKRLNFLRECYYEINKIVDFNEYFSGLGKTLNFLYKKDNYLFKVKMRDIIVHIADTISSQRKINFLSKEEYIEDIVPLLKDFEGFYRNMLSELDEFFEYKRFKKNPRKRKIKK